MFCRAVAKRAGVYLAVFMLPLLTAVLPSATAQIIIGPPPAVCDMVGNGTLATGDAFVGQVTVNPGGFGSGTWIHFTPDRSVPGQGGGACVLIERMCTRLGAAGLTTPYCTGPLRGCVRDVFEGVVFNAGCSPAGSSTTVSFQGSGLFNGIPNYTFSVVALDDGRDSYGITITAPDGTTIQHNLSGDLDSGDIDTTVF